MKKIVKLSLIAAAAVAGLSTSSLAADSIAEAFQNGKVKGSVKSFYFAKSTDANTADKDSSIWVNGGSINYVTDSYNGLVFGATFQTSHVGTIDDDGATKTFSATMDASGSVLSESYLQYTYANTTFKGGRQYISTPLLAGSGSRMIKQSFEAYLLVNTDLPDTTIVAGNVTKFAGRTDGTGDVGSFNKLGTGSGVATVYIKNTSIDNLTARFQYADYDETANLLYVDAVYKMPSDLKPFIGIQYFDTDTDDSANKDNSLYGIKAGMNIKGIDLFLGYTSTSGTTGDNNVNHGVGSAAFANYTTTTETAGGDAFKAGTDAARVAIGYNFAGVKAKIAYTTFDNVVNDLDETTLNLSYKFTKNLGASLDYSMMDYETNDTDKTALRTKLTYSF
ncbi:OprD family outer membrane porin [Arcobacteraceae bacterium]|nr:OprD family outer membrane porin [Arcobacteraceae bacterium]